MNPMLLAATTLGLLGLPLAAAQPEPGCPLNFTAAGQADGSVVFHWFGFAGAEGYQVFGHAGLGNTAGYSPMLDGNARDYTAHNLATGDYVFWVTAYHSGTVVASSCERSTHVGPASVPFFPSATVAAAAGIGSVGLAFLVFRRK